uniref:RRM domain-containing protein n=1 Tax=Rhabditophanes sp. KR3021 TaxID=114890 RepID=A0AC35UDK7_9BILA
MLILISQKLVKTRGNIIATIGQLIISGTNDSVGNSLKLDGSGLDGNVTSSHHQTSTGIKRGSEAISSTGGDNTRIRDQLYFEETKNDGGTSKEKYLRVLEQQSKGPTSSNDDCPISTKRIALPTNFQTQLAGGNGQMMDPSQMYQSSFPNISMMPNLINSGTNFTHFTGTLDQSQLNSMLLAHGNATLFHQLETPKLIEARPSSEIQGNVVDRNTPVTPPNCVLRVIFGNIYFAISLEAIHQTFSRFGTVLRIITFSKNGIFQALVQLSDPASADLAKTYLDNQVIVQGCGPLKIEYSKLTNLNIKYNNEKSRDYTKPHLPAGDFIYDPTALLNTTTQLSSSGARLQQTPTSYTLPFAQFQTTQPQQLLTSPVQLALNQANLQNYLNSATSCQSQANSMMQASLGNNNLISHQLQNVLNVGQLGMIQMATSPVCLVTNLDASKTTPDVLFTLFGVYGDVQRVKILYNQRSQALVEYAEAPQAALAIKHLDNTRWNNNYMRVAVSKYSTVQIRLDGKQDETSTKDYSHSPLHRFRKPGSKNYQNIYAPNATLHLSNIPLNITEQFLVNSFTEKGFVVVAFKFFPNNHKMALIQLDSIEGGINSLIQMHNFRLAENAHLKVSFSKSTLKTSMVLC